MPKYFVEIDVGGVRMDSYGSVWTRMGPYGPWGLPGGFLGPPGALGGPERGVKGGSPPGGARGALLGGLPSSLRGILTYMALGLLMVGPIVESSLTCPLRAAYGAQTPAAWRVKFCSCASDCIGSGAGFVAGRKGFSSTSIVLSSAKTAPATGRSRASI